MDIESALSRQGAVLDTTLIREELASLNELKEKPATPIRLEAMLRRHT